MPDDATVAARSMPIAEEFQAQLKEQLVAALGQGGPEMAVGVCKEAAPAIAAGQSEASGAQVSRIAERHRNRADDDLSDEDGQARFPQGFTTLRPYLRTVKID